MIYFFHTLNAALWLTAGMLIVRWLENLEPLII